MKSHELAQKLLELPDLEVIFPIEKIPGTQNSWNSGVVTEVRHAKFELEPYPEYILLQGEKYEDKK